MIRKVSLVVVLVLLLGSYAVEYGAPGLLGVSKPAMILLVREAPDDGNFTMEQLGWINDPKIRAAIEKNGSKFYKIDQHIVGPDKKTPAEFAPAIALVKDKLPRIVFVGPRGALTEYVVPANEAEARKRFGLPAVGE